MNEQISGICSSWSDDQSFRAPVGLRDAPELDGQCVRL